MQLRGKLESHFANENRHCKTNPMLRKVTQHLAHFGIPAPKAFFSFAAKTIAMRFVQLNSIIEIEHSVNDANVTIVNENDKCKMPLRTPATYLVAEATNSTAANASAAKKALGPLVIRMKIRFRSR